MNAQRWVVEEPGKPLARVDFELQEPEANEVVVEVAGCGVCHTDLGFYFDGVSPRHPYPLALGHEISGRVVRAGTDVKDWQDKTVIVPAVIPCGTCDLCLRGHGTICRKPASSPIIFWGLASYGWGDDWRAGLLTDDGILARLKADTGSNGSVTDATRAVRRVMVFMIGILLSVEILWRL